MEFTGVKEGCFNCKQMLSPLNKEERFEFMNSMEKLRYSEGSIASRQALCVMFLDMVHTSHQDELATITSALVNKLMNPPYRKDREMLKSVLEAIMGAVSMAEKMMDEKDNANN